MKKMHFFLVLTFISITVSCDLNGQKDVTLTSPNHSIQLNIDSDGDSIFYRVTYHRKEVVSKGMWGVVIDGESLLSHGLYSIQGPSLMMDTVSLRTGNVTVEKYHEYFVRFSENQQIQIRLYNNAYAYRYLVQNQRGGVLSKERSSWRVPDSTQTWFFERENSWKLKSYAGEWHSCRADMLHTVSPTGPVQGPPLIFEFGNDVYGMLTEAALYHYSGMRLLAEEGGKLGVDFTEAEGFALEGNLQSPWRVFYIGKGLNELVNQQVINSLNPNPDPILFADLGYIRPGKAAWRWWSKKTGTPKQELQSADFASSLGFEYSLIDDGWEKWENAWGEVRNIISHAKENQVKILLWKHSNELNLPENDYCAMREWLDKIKAAGAAGAKVDFMNSEAKSIIDFEIRLLEEAAKRKLTIVFHGCHKPTGENFTYPNELTREGIRGLELNGHPEGPIHADHNAALPFTRFVVGDGDYTPIGFTNPGNTTWTHQLATLVCFTSYLQVIAEDPEFLLTNRQVKPVLELIQEMPTVWDETIVLEGSRIGQVAAMARRSGTDWYVGVLNTTSRIFDLDFDFLGTGSYQALVVEDHTTDDGQNDKFSIEMQDVARDTRRNFTLSENGGLVIKITKV